MRGLAIVSLMVMTGSAAAQDDFDLGGDDYLSELPVVLTVTRLPQVKSELPTAVTVIDREMIDASGAVALPDLFRLVAGFQVGHYHGPDGPRTAVTYHGNTNQYSRRMQVLVDGRSVYTWGTGGAEWADIPINIDDIERIEVSRGPNGVTYGSNAFLGVINIITKHASMHEGTDVRVTLDDDAYRGGMLRYSGGKGDFNYRVTASYESDDGFEPYLSAGGTLYELNDDIETTSLDFRGDLRTGVNDYLTFKAGILSGLRQVGESMDPLDEIRGRDVTSHYQQIQWKRVLSSDNEINLQVYHHLHRVDDHFTTVPLPVALDINTTVQSERYDIELSHQLRMNQSLRAVWGAELRQDEVSGEDYFDLGATYQQRLSRLFANFEWRPAEHWVVNLGDMVEDSDNFGSYHSPRLAVNRLLGKGGYLRASSGRAYRVPTAIESNADFVVRTVTGIPVIDAYEHATDIEPERIDSVEMAFGLEKRGYGYEVKIFREKISSEIDAVRDLSWPTDHWVIMNVGETTNRGMELQLKARTDDSLASIAYSYVRSSGIRLDKLNPDIWVDSGDSVPLQTISATFSKRLAEKLWGSINLYNTTPMQYYAGDRTEGVAIADVVLRQGFNLAGREGKISLALKNLLGPYYDFEEETISSKSVYVTLEMDL